MNPPNNLDTFSFHVPAAYICVNDCSATLTKREDTCKHEAPRLMSFSRGAAGGSGIYSITSFQYAIDDAL